MMRKVNTVKNVNTIYKVEVYNPCDPSTLYKQKNISTHGNCGFIGSTR